MMKITVSRLALKIVVMARQKARVKRVWAILRFFTQFGFIVFTYLITPGLSIFWAVILRKGIN